LSCCGAKEVKEDSLSIFIMDRRTLYNGLRTFHYGVDDFQEKMGKIMKEKNISIRIGRLSRLR